MKPSAVTIRPARLSDAGAIAALTKQLGYIAEAEEWAVHQGCAVVRLWSSATRTEAHEFYRRVGYTNVKTQYSFAKSVGATGPDALRAFVPDVT